jgi:hypothetical protein
LALFVETLRDEALASEPYAYGGLVVTACVKRL